mgnify:CR=1 FL=1
MHALQLTDILVAHQMPMEGSFEMISFIIKRLLQSILVMLTVALIAFALFGPADISWKWVGWIGVMPLVTAFLKWCPAYTLFGIRTCKAD